MVRRACVFDWDGTLRSGITTLSWFEFLVPFIPKAQTSADQMRHLLYDYKSNKVNYPYLVKHAGELCASCVADMSVGEVTSLATLFVEVDRDNLYKFSAAVLDAAKRRGYTTFIISGAPTEILVAYSSMLSVDKAFGLEIKRIGDTYSDAVSANFGLTEQKKEAVAGIIASGFDIALAVGNSESDLPLLEHARNRFIISDEQESITSIRASFVYANDAEEKLLEVL